MCDASVNAMKWINAHSNELDSIRFRFASILVCSVNGPSLYLSPSLPSLSLPPSLPLPLSLPPSSLYRKTTMYWMKPPFHPCCHGNKLSNQLVAARAPFLAGTSPSPPSNFRGPSDDANTERFFGGSWMGRRWR